jgi:hypothetical protein
MTFGRRVRFYRVGFGLLFLFLFHLLTDLPVPGLFRDWRQRETLGTVDDVTAFERRLEKVRQELPARGVVGSGAQLRNKGPEVVFTYRTGRALIDLSVMDCYWLTQYSVAPVIVEYSGEHPLTIVNRTDDAILVRSEGR